MTETNDTTQKLNSYIQRIERLEQEKQDIATDIKEVYLEAKGFGLDPKTIRKLVKLRKIEAEKRAEEQSLLETYADAIGLDHVYI